MMTSCFLELEDSLSKLKYSMIKYSCPKSTIGDTICNNKGREGVCDVLREERESTTPPNPYHYFFLNFLFMKELGE